MNDVVLIVMVVMIIIQVIIVILFFKMSSDLSEIKRRDFKPQDFLPTKMYDERFKDKVEKAFYSGRSDLAKEMLLCMKFECEKDPKRQAELIAYIDYKLKQC